MGLGLQGAYSVNALDELINQRRKQKMEEAAVAEKLRAQRVHEGLQSQQLDQERSQANIQNQRNQQTDVLRNLSMYTPQEQLSPEAVQQAGDAGLQGYLRTVGPEQAQLPSVQATGMATEGASPQSAGLGVLRSNQGQEEGTFRRSTGQERQFEETNQRQLDTALANIQGRQEEGAANRASREGMAADSNQLRQSLAEMARGQMTASQSVMAQIAQEREARQQSEFEQKKKTDQAKLDEVTASKAKTEGAAVQGANDIIGMVDKLEKSPGFSNVFGARVPGAGYFPGETANSQAMLEQIKSALSIEKIMEMKAQSRTGATGFGQLSDRELNVLQNAAGRLQTAQTETAARTAFEEIRTTMRRVIERNKGKAGAAGSGKSPTKFTFTVE